MRTQWRAGGMGGPTGLDYNVLLWFVGRMNLDADEEEELIAEVQVMEGAALEYFQERQSERQRSKK